MGVPLAGAAHAPCGTFWSSPATIWSPELVTLNELKSETALSTFCIIWQFCQASTYKHLGAQSMFFIMKHFVSSAAEEAGVAPRSSQLCECRHLRRSCGRHVRLASSSRSLKVSVTGFSEENSITRSLTCAIKIGCNLRTRLTHLFLAEKQASICIV